MKPKLIIHDKKVLANMEKLRKKTPDASERSMLRAVELLRGYIVKNKLSGQVLKRRAGGAGLAGSIRTEVVGKKDETIGRVGSNFKYARIHELGGIILPVRAKYLAFVIEGQFILASEVVMPKRPYIEPSMKEMTPRLQKEIGQKFWTEITSG